MQLYFSIRLEIPLKMGLRLMVRRNVASGRKGRMKMRIGDIQQGGKIPRGYKTCPRCKSKETETLKQWDRKD